MSGAPAIDIALDSRICRGERRSSGSRYDRPRIVVGSISAVCNVCRLAGRAFRALYEVTA